MIDPRLRGWGWAVVPFDPATSADQRGCCAIAEYPTANGPADYALVVDGKLLGIVEAKKLTLGPQGHAAGYDVNKDFAPVGLIPSTPIVVMAHPSLPVKSLADVIALAKKEPR